MCPHFRSYSDHTHHNTSIKSREKIQAILIAHLKPSRQRDTTSSSSPSPTATLKAARNWSHLVCGGGEGGGEEGREGERRRGEREGGRKERKEKEGGGGRK